MNLLINYYLGYTFDKSEGCNAPPPPHAIDNSQSLSFNPPKKLPERQHFLFLHN